MFFRSILISQTLRLLGIFLVFSLFPGTHLVATTRFQPRPGQYPNRWWSLDLFHQLEPSGDDSGRDTVAYENL